MRFFLTINITMCNLNKESNKYQNNIDIIYKLTFEFEM